MSHLHVTPEELAATAGVLQGRSETLGTVQNQISGATVPAGAFGRIPGLGPELDQHYTEHITTTTQMLQSATTGVNAAATSLRATAQGFAELEKQTAQNIQGSVPS